MPQSLWGAVRRTISMGLIYGAGLQPSMILVNLPPGALPQAGMKRAFGASSLWKVIDWPLPKCTNSKARSAAARRTHLAPVSSLFLLSHVRGALQLCEELFDIKRQPRLECGQGSNEEEEKWTR